MLRYEALLRMERIYIHEFERLCISIPELPEVDDDLFSKQNYKFGFIAKAAYIEDMKDLNKKLSIYNENKLKVYAS